MVLYQQIRNLTVPGSARYSGQITPSVSGTLNDWAPTDFAGAFLVTLSPTAATTITGMQAAPHGTFKMLEHGGSTDYPVDLPSEAAGSTAAQRFSSGYHGDLRLQKGERAFFHYDGTAQRWELVWRSSAWDSNVRRPSFFRRTEAAWWKVPGSLARQRYGMPDAENVDGVGTNLDDATGPWMSVSTGSLPYGPADPGVTEKAGACGIRTGPYLYQRRWSVRAGFDRIAIPNALESTLGRWGCFDRFQIYGVDDLADIECACFEFDYSDDQTQVYAVTSDGADATRTVLPTVAPGTAAEYLIDMDASAVRFFYNGSLVATNTTTLPGADTMLGQSVMCRLLAGGSAVKRVTWARCGYSHG